jgi:hypothetical protein
LTALKKFSGRMLGGSWRLKSGMRARMRSMMAGSLSVTVYLQGVDLRRRYA